MSHLRDRRAFGSVGTRRFRGARFGDGKSPKSNVVFNGIQLVFNGTKITFNGQ